MVKTIVEFSKLETNEIQSIKTLSKAFARVCSTIRDLYDGVRADSQLKTMQKTRKKPKINLKSDLGLTYGPETDQNEESARN